MNVIREIIKPQQNQVTINIPDDYINKEVEFIILPLDIEQNIKAINNSKKNNKKNDISSLRGSLNKYADPSKIELEEKAWDMHVMEKFKAND